MNNPFPQKDVNLAFIIRKLQVSGRTWTPQRNAFYTYFINLTQPTNAESIWLQLRANGLVMSRETAYNTLRLLVELEFAERKWNELTSAYEFMPVKKTIQ